MIIINFLRGGLGNQLFQYAAALSLTKKFDCQLEHNSSLLPDWPDTLRGVSRWPEQISAFNFSGTLRRDSKQPPNRTSLKSKILTLKFLRAKIFETRTVEKRRFILDQNIDSFFTMSRERISQEKLLMYGYFQRPELFESNKAEIYNQICRLKQPSDEHLRLMDSMNFSVPVIHLRLGDKAVLDREYTSRKILALRQSIQDLQFDKLKVRIFTDTPEFFLRESDSTFRNSEIFHSKHLTPLENLQLLAKHEFIIGSDSSFFWWAKELQKHRNPAAESVIF